MEKNRLEASLTIYRNHLEAMLLQIINNSSKMKYPNLEKIRKKKNEIIF